MEENVAKALLDIEAVATEHKKDLTNFLLDSCKEVSYDDSNLLTVIDLKLVKTSVSRLCSLCVPQDLCPRGQICDYRIREEVQVTSLLRYQAKDRH